MKEKEELMEKVKSLSCENLRDLKNYKMNFKILLFKIFTPGQVKSILSNNKRVKWSSEDIASAITLRSVSPKAYRYLRQKLNYPLPGLTTLNRWTNFLNLDEGILEDVMLLLKNKAKNMKKDETIVVLSFDEMHLSELINFDRKAFMFI